MKTAKCEPEPDAGFGVTTSVTRFAKISPLWQKNKVFGQLFMLINYLAQFGTYFGSFCYWTNSHCCKWPNTEHIIWPSGHAAHN